ncbi:MAG: type II secretion system minor pseudopilin GspI [Henriciella sp.]|nr:type II secretion system minor pseudopilin GspI [Henriciella sp.]
MLNVETNPQSGFSLVETVAAMGILALAAVPLLQITTDATRNAANLEGRVLARTVAENVMARAMATPETIDAGIATGSETQMGRTFIWTRTASLPQLGELQNLEVQVRREEDEQVVARLVSLKYMPAILSVPSTTAPTSDEEET